MTRERSPNYPGIGLPSAVELLERLFQQERRSIVPLEVAVRAWGHDSLSGPARVRIAALRQYGLVDFVKDNKIRISDLGLTICVPPDEQRRKTSVREAALSPPLFHQLWSTMRDASDGAIRHFLMRERGFSLDGTNRVIKSYRTTIAFANLSDESYDDEAERENGEDVDMTLVADLPPTTETVQAKAPNAVAPGSNFRFGPLPSGIVADVIFSNPHFTVQDIEMLKEYLTLQARGLQMAEELRRVGATSPTEHEPQL